MTVSATRRISDARLHNVPAIYPEYSSVDPFNCDGTRLLLTHFDQFGLWDGDGVFIRDLRLNASSRPRWLPDNPASAYYVNGSELRICDPDTGYSDEVERFGNYTAIDIGGGEGRIAGHTMALVGDGKTPFFFDAKTFKHKYLTTEPRPVESAYLTPDGNAMLVSWRERFPGERPPMQLFNREGQLLRNLPPNGHKDICTVSGRPVLVWCNSDDPNPIACPNGVVMIDLSTGEQTCLTPLAWGLGMHPCGAFADHVLVSTFISPGTTHPTDGPYSEKIILINLITGKITEIARHGTTVRDESDQPRALISLDGRKVLWQSNMGGQVNDTWMVELTEDAPIEPPPPPPIEPVDPAEDPEKRLEGLLREMRDVIARYS